MNCEYCGRFLQHDNCAGCGAPNPYQHHGDPIRLRAGIEPRYHGRLNTAAYSSAAYLNSSGFMSTNMFRFNYSTTKF